MRLSLSSYKRRIREIICWSAVKVRLSSGMSYDNMVDFYHSLKFSFFLKNFQMNSRLHIIDPSTIRFYLVSNYPATMFLVTAHIDMDEKVNKFEVDVYLRECK